MPPIHGGECRRVLSILNRKPMIRGGRMIEAARCFCHGQPQLKQKTVPPTPAERPSKIFADSCPFTQPAVKDCVALGFPPLSWYEIAKLWLRALGYGVFSGLLLTTEDGYANSIRTEHQFATDTSENLCPSNRCFRMATWGELVQPKI